MTTFTMRLAINDDETDETVEADSVSWLDKAV